MMARGWVAGDDGRGLTRRLDGSKWVMYMCFDNIDSSLERRKGRVAGTQRTEPITKRHRRTVWRRFRFGSRSRITGLCMHEYLAGGAMHSATNVVSVIAEVDAAGHILKTYSTKAHGLSQSANTGFVY